MDGLLMVSSYSAYYHRWTGWETLPGTLDRAKRFCTNRCYFWNADSYPTLSARGSGLIELFINGTRDDGAQALLHTWTDRWNNDAPDWSANWESLGTGRLSGSPTAVSWGTGRTDVFVRAADYGIAHKWYANGSWSRGW
jgi:hypothetical protein